MMCAAETHMDHWYHQRASAEIAIHLPRTRQQRHVLQPQIVGIVAIDQPEIAAPVRLGAIVEDAQAIRTRSRDLHDANRFGQIAQRARNAPQR